MNKFPLIAASLLCVSAPAIADHRADSCNSATRDNSLWSEKESWENHGSKTKKAKIDQSASEGKIVVDATGGKGGSAAYMSQWVVDWTDSFAVEFEHEMESQTPTSLSKSAASGMAFGFGGFNLETGYANGVNVQVVQAKTGRSIQIVAKHGNAVQLQASANITTAAHGFHVVWVASAAHTVTVKVFADGNETTPIVELPGVADVLAGKEGTGMSVALFGQSKGNWKFQAKFDNVSFSGDDFDDDGDSGFDDADDTNDDHGDHMDDESGDDNGGSSGDDSGNDGSDD